MTNEFTEARRRKIIQEFKRAARDLIELESGPFTEFRTDIVSRGDSMTVVLEIEGRP